LQEDNISLDELLADANECLRRTQHTTSDCDLTPIRPRRHRKKKSRLNKALLALAMAGVILLETVLLLAGTLYNPPKTENEKYAYDIIQKAYWINEKKIEMLDYKKRNKLIENYYRHFSGTQKQKKGGS
jgi:hypothetical protein